METRKNLFLIFSILFSLGFISCTKEGAPGPKGDAGLTGATGTQGLTGTQGATGAQGNPGTSAVKTVVLNVASTEWTYNNNSALVDKTVNELTTAVVDNGLVMVYMQGVSAGTWIALPSGTQGPNGPLNIGYNYSVGHLRINATQPGPGPLSGLGAYTFKVVMQ
jgi:hypothetical protein